MGHSSIASLAIGNIKIACSENFVGPPLLNNFQHKRFSFCKPRVVEADINYVKLTLGIRDN